MPLINSISRNTPSYHVYLIAITDCALTRSFHSIPNICFRSLTLYKRSVNIHQAGDHSISDTEMLPTTSDASQYAANEVAARLRVDTRTGLAWSEANYRTKIVGHNELNVNDEEPTWKKYAQQFQNPLILLLLGE